MKVTVFSFTGFDSLNGSNLRVFHLCNELLRREHELKFVVPGVEDARSCREKFGSEAVDVGMEISRFNSSRLRRYPLFAMKASKLAGKSDILFGQSLPSALAVRRAKTQAKKIIDYVDLWSEYWSYANPGVKGGLIYSIIKKAEAHSLKVDRIVTITKTLKKMLTERGADARSIKVIRDGVDTKLFGRVVVEEEFFKKYGLEKHADYVTYQGGISAHDGVQFLIDSSQYVIKDNPGIKFLIIGDGAYLPKIKNMVHEKGLDRNFVFTGWVPYSDMPRFMNIAKLNVVPIPDAPATSGVVTLKLFEAMACGTPTVIGNLPGVREAVEHKRTAYLVRSEDAKTLSSGINELLDDRILYNRIKWRGLELAKKHDWRLIASDMADIIEYKK